MNKGDMIIYPEVKKVELYVTETGLKTSIDEEPDFVKRQELLNAIKRKYITFLEISLESEGVKQKVSRTLLVALDLLYEWSNQEYQESGGPLSPKEIDFVEKFLSLYEASSETDQELLMQIAGMYIMYRRMLAQDSRNAAAKKSSEPEPMETLNSYTLKKIIRAANSYLESGWDEAEWEEIAEEIFDMIPKMEGYGSYYKHYENHNAMLKGLDLIFRKAQADVPPDSKSLDNGLPIRNLTPTEMHFIYYFLSLNDKDSNIWNIVKDNDDFVFFFDIIVKRSPEWLPYILGLYILYERSHHI